MEKKLIQVKDKSYKLLFDNFDEDMEVDSLLKIDYSNLIGELITFPVIVNRFGNLLAEAESQVSEANLIWKFLKQKQKKN